MHHSFLKILKNTLLIISMVGLIASCSGKKSGEVVCPDVKVLKDTDHLTRFKPGPGRDITDILVQANLRRANGSCQVFGDYIELFLATDMQASQGAALNAAEYDIDFLIGITDKSGAFIKHRKLPISLTFPVNQSVINYREIFQITIPLEEDQSPADFRLYVGYGLSKDELAYNRNN